MYTYVPTPQVKLRAEPYYTVNYPQFSHPRFHLRMRLTLKVMELLQRIVKCSWRSRTQTTMNTFSLLLRLIASRARCVHSARIDERVHYEQSQLGV